MEEDLSKLEKNNHRYKKKKKKKAPAGETSPSLHPPTLPSLPQCGEGTQNVWEGKGQTAPRAALATGHWGQGDSHIAYHCWGAWLEWSSSHGRLLSSHLQ